MTTGKLPQVSVPPQGLHEDNFVFRCSRATGTTLKLRAAEVGKKSGFSVSNNPTSSIRVEFEVIQPFSVR